MHEGPCSHLCGLKRLADAHLIEIPFAHLRKADLEIPGEDQELQQYVDRETAADGGRRADR
jgi:hypothetical protein